MNNQQKTCLNVWLLKCAKAKNYECKQTPNSTSQQTCDVQVQHEKVEKVMMFKFDLWNVKTKKTTMFKVDLITPLPKKHINYNLTWIPNTKFKSVFLKNTWTRNHYNKRCPCMLSDFTRFWMNSLVVINRD